MLDWDDLRYFLTVADHGSTLAAGRALRVSQTTAARRVAALEVSLGLTLFDRRPAGYALTPAGEALLPEARAAAAAIARVTEVAAAQARADGGIVRLTAPEILAVTILAPILRDLHQAFPAIRIEIDTSDAVRDLAAGAADIALRVSSSPKGAGLVGRRLMDDHWTVYCSRTYAARHGCPRDTHSLAGHPFIGGGEPGVWAIYRAWLERHGLMHAVAMHHGTSTGLLAAVRAGVGLAALPCIVADREPDLIRCLKIDPKAQRGLWLLTHERLRTVPRIRSVLGVLGPRLSEMAP